MPSRVTPDCIEKEARDETDIPELEAKRTPKKGALCAVRCMQ
jgi:hypothetical protein